MSSDTHRLRRSLAVQIVRADIEGLFDWHHQTKSPSREIYALVFAPVFSLFLIEFRKFVARYDPRLTTMPPGLEQVAQRSRAALKQAEVTGPYVEQLARVIDLHDSEFRGDGRGLRGWLRRALGHDMAIWTVESKLVLTTHHVAIALGSGELSPLPSWKIGRRGHEIGRMVGEYVGASATALGIRPSEDAARHIIFEATDLRSESYLREAGRHLGSSSLAFTAALLGAVAAVNVAAVVIPRGPWRSALFPFKLRFVTMFHALESLRKLKAFGCTHDLLSSEGLRRLSGSRDTVRATRQLLAHVKLRKLLVHYAEVDADERDLLRGSLASLSEELATGSVPKELDDLLVQAVTCCSADFLFLERGR